MQESQSRTAMVVSIVTRSWVAVIAAAMIPAALVLDGMPAMLVLVVCAAGLLALDAERWRQRHRAERWQAVAIGWRERYMATRARLDDDPRPATGEDT